MISRPRCRWPRYIAGGFSCLILLITATAATGAHFALDVAAQIHVIPEDNFSPPPEQGPSPRPGAPINLLLMGSDTRDGDNAKGYGNPSVITGARSDTTILLHISGDRTRALAVSIPRDSLVPLADCKIPGGGTIGSGRLDRINAAFSYGGPGCTVKTVQELTGVTIHHYLVVDFTGFKNVVNELDGVEVCLTKPVNDSHAKLVLPAGKSIVRGEQALGFVRVRETIGDGSDLQRIDRQQEFLSSAIRKATSVGVLINPPKLFQVLSSATASLTADKGLANFEALKNLAIDVSAVKPENVAFATVPWVTNGDGVTISWVPSQAQQLWNAINQDTQWPPPGTTGNDGKLLYAAPATTSVNVVNGSRADGAGNRAAALLRSEGYRVASRAGSSKDVATTTIEYNPDIGNQAEEARTLSYATGANLKAIKRKNEVLTLVVGPDFAASLKPVTTSKDPSAPTAPAKPRNAAESMCSG